MPIRKRLLQVQSTRKPTSRHLFINVIGASCEWCFFNLTCRCNRVPLLRTPPRREPQLRGTFGESVARKFGTSYLYRDRTGNRWRSDWPGCLASLGCKWIRLCKETHYKRSTCTILIYKCIYLSMSTQRCRRVRIDTINIEMQSILAAPTPPCIHTVNF